MVKRHPDTATITWKSGGTKASDGTITEGSSSSVSIACNIQPSSGSYKQAKHGNIVDYSYKIFTSIFSQADSIPDDAEIKFNGRTFKIVLVSPYQKHVEIRC